MSDENVVSFGAFKAAKAHEEPKPIRGDESSRVTTIREMAGLVDPFKNHVATIMQAMLVDTNDVIACLNGFSLAADMTVSTLIDSFYPSECPDSSTSFIQMFYFRPVSINYSNPEQMAKTLRKRMTLVKTWCESANVDTIHSAYMVGGMIAKVFLERAVKDAVILTDYQAGLEDDILHESFTFDDHVVLQVTTDLDSLKRSSFSLMGACHKKHTKSFCKI